VHISVSKLRSSVGDARIKVGGKSNDGGPSLSTPKKRPGRLSSPITLGLNVRALS